LVAQGFSQVPGVDYFDTFAPVAKLVSIHAVLAIMATYNIEIHQIYIKGAFLNRKLTDKKCIYIQQPSGFTNPVHSLQVCYLRKTLYGLKQSRRQWYQRLCKILVDNLEFTYCDIDQSVFFKVTSHRLTIILVYVDNCTIMTTSIGLVNWIKNGMKKFVEITNLEEIH